MVARTIDEQFTALKEAHPEVLARHWTEAGETEPAIAQWSRAGKAARGAQRVQGSAGELPAGSGAAQHCCPNRPSVTFANWSSGNQSFGCLQSREGMSAPETIEATERAAALAEKSGNLKQLVNRVVSRGFAACISGDLPAAGTLADQALELALREGSPTSLGLAHTLQIHNALSSWRPRRRREAFHSRARVFRRP